MSEEHKTKRIPAPWREDNLPTGPELFRVIEPNFIAWLYREPDIDSETIAYMKEDNETGRPIVGYLCKHVLNTRNVKFWWFYVITPYGVGWMNSYNCSRNLRGW